AQAPTAAPEDNHPIISAANAARLKPIRKIDNYVWEVTRGPGQHELTFVEWEKSITVYDDKQFRKLRTIAEGKKPTHFATSKDRRLLAWAENNSRATILNTVSGKTVENETGNDQPGLAFCPDNTMLASGGYGTQAKVWDTAGELIRALNA